MQGCVLVVMMEVIQTSRKMRLQNTLLYELLLYCLDLLMIFISQSEVSSQVTVLYR